MYDDYSNAKMQIGQCANNQLGYIQQQTDRTRLQQKKRMLQEELDRVNAAIDMLDKHPDLEEFARVLKLAL